MLSGPLGGSIVSDRDTECQSWWLGEKLIISSNHVLDNIIKDNFHNECKNVVNTCLHHIFKWYCKIVLKEQNSPIKWLIRK